MTSLSLTPTTPTTLSLSTGGVAGDVIWDAKGDIAVGSAPDTAARLPVGSNGQVLTADSAQTLGVKWSAAAGGMVADTLWDAKGDLAVASAADTGARLPVGSNNQVLTADSAQTLGVKWATPAAGGAVASDAIWDTKGDLAVATGADAASKLVVGTNGQVLTADSAQTTGVKWATPSAGGGGAWTLLSTTNLAADGTIDVSSISGSYNDLILVGILRGTTAGSVTENLAIRLNNDSGTNYSSVRQQQSGTTITGNETIANANGLIGTMPGPTATANFFGMIELTIPGYASTAWAKVMHWRSWVPGVAGAGSLYNWSGGVLWNSTAAVTRVTVYGFTTANLLTGSQLRIYGCL